MANFPSDPKAKFQGTDHGFVGTSLLPFLRGLGADAVVRDFDRRALARLSFMAAAVAAAIATLAPANSARAGGRTTDGVFDAAQVQVAQASATRPPKNFNWHIGGKPAKPDVK